jgi:hypothetical protein
MLDAAREVQSSVLLERLTERPKQQLAGSERHAATDHNPIEVEQRRRCRDAPANRDASLLDQPGSRWLAGPRGHDDVLAGRIVRQV